MGLLLSEEWHIGRGTRQGCPLSPLLFAIAIEPLAAWTRKVMLPWGIDVNGGIHLMSLYAIDTLFYLNDPTRSVPKLITGLERFGQISGLKVNQHKSVLFPLGNLADRTVQSLPTLPIKWETESFKYLDAMIVQTPSKRQQFNIIRVIEGL